MSGFVKIYGTILDSSVWSEGPWVRLVWITMLAMADETGYVSAALPGLARRANVPLDECAAAVEVLESPDRHDRSGVEEGRRIRKVPGGWQIVNYQAYRELRTEEQIAKAERQRRWRAGRASTVDGGASTVDDVDAMRREVSASSSASGFAVEEGMQGEELVRSTPEVADAVYDFVGEYDFGPYADMVLAIVRLHRFPPAAVATLRAHLQGLDRIQCTALELGVACQDYLAANGREFNPAHFAGFVRRAKGRKAQEREARVIEQHQTAKAEEERAAEARAAARRAAIAAFATDQPRRYNELAAQSEAEVDKAATGRPYLVKARLFELIAEEVDRAKTA